METAFYTGEVKSLPHLPHGMEVVQLEAALLDGNVCMHWVQVQN